MIFNEGVERFRAFTSRVLSSFSEVEPGPVAGGGELSVMQLLAIPRDQMTPEQKRQLSIQGKENLRRAGLKSPAVATPVVTESKSYFNYDPAAARMGNQSAELRQVLNNAHTPRLDGAGRSLDTSAVDR